MERRWKPFLRATWRADVVGIWAGVASAAFTGITSLVEDGGVAVTFLMMLAAFPLAFLVVVLISFRHDVADWIGSVLGREQMRQARAVAGLPADERKMAQRRFLIADAFRMVDDVEKKFKRLKKSNRQVYLKILIREDNTYYRVARYLSEETRGMVHTIPGIRIEPALTIGGEESYDDRLLRKLREDIAELEISWDLI